ncbi:diguanylate cyclase (GGDEF) domain-containing protein [Roseibium suaedae]|uniref:Diguanylate cyclase (GGDEF) domain-containing protein n=1 Tax=Roseibium suaedae TaxID=735517 RepID=A0A1M6YZK2_9HYPH|nr:diguanylate cyclase (GGDEF) domain-containing protein [Roseibium suaedae]
MQNSQRPAAGNIALLALPGGDLLAGASRALLETLVQPAGLANADGTLFAANAPLMRQLGLKTSDLPITLPKALSPESWIKCKTAFATAVNGAACEVFGLLYGSSGQALGPGLGFSLLTGPAATNQILLIQALDLPEEAMSSGTYAAANPEMSLEHFPEDWFLINPEDSIGVINARITGLTDCLVSPVQLAECVQEARSGRASNLLIPIRAIGEDGLVAAGQHAIEVRFMPGSRDQDAEGAVLAVARHGVPCPRGDARTGKADDLDPLTGLLNRRAFQELLDAGLQQSGSSELKDVAVFYLDIDGFKSVNDLGGRAAGDAMLNLVAGVIKDCTPEKGAAARINGDEFALFCPIEGYIGAQAIALSLRDGLAGLHLDTEGHAFSVAGSIGVCIVPPSAALEGAKAADVLHHADLSCLRSKRGNVGSVQVEMFNPSATAGHSALGPKLAFSARPVLSEFRMEELELASQPILRLETMRPIGLDVVLKPRSEEDGQAASSHQEDQRSNQQAVALLDAWIVDQALDAATVDETKVFRSLTISQAALEDRRFSDLLRNRLAGNPLLAGRLCLQVTERTYLRAPGSSTAFLRFATELGCQTAIDDFMGHWPVLSRLSGLRLDWIRLSSDLTSSVEENYGQRVLLKGIVASAHDIGLRIIAKGPATESRIALLNELAVDALQGCTRRPGIALED